MTGLRFVGSVAEFRRWLATWPLTLPVVVYADMRRHTHLSPPRSDDQESGNSPRR